MMIPQHKIDEIASTVDIVDVISGYTQLRKAGKNFMGRCPFHEERTPSFSVSQEKGVYHCFGCGKSGNMFTFLMDIENISFFEAAKELAAKANIQLEFESEVYDEDRNKIEILYEINRTAAQIFYDNLKGRHGEYGREYLSRRGIADDMITKFGMGYALREKSGLFAQLKEQFSMEDLLGSGLFVDLGKSEIRDRFRGRLMFPIISESGKVVGFGGRRVFEDVSEEAKYINSPETKIYNKSKTLFGLNLTKNSIKQKGYAILVEGYLDLISLYQHGIDNVIASSGTSLTPLHVKILSRYIDEIVILYDSDLAGQNASRRAIELILENDLKTTVIELPAGDDPDTFIRKQGHEKFNTLLQNRINIIDYIGSRYRKSGKLGTPDGNTEFVREIIGLIGKIKDEIKRDFYIKDISQRFSIYESIIRKELENHLRTKSKGMVRESNVSSEKITAPDNREIIVSLTELILIRILVDTDKNTKDYLIENLEIDLINNPEVAKIVNHLMMLLDKGEDITHVKLFNEFSDENSKEILGKALLDDSYVLQDKKKSYMDEARTIISQLKLGRIRHELKEIENHLKSSNEYSDSSIDLLTEQKKLQLKKIELEKELRT
ncbi:MAG TPA: DNA primase [Ignavibacteria bacterium]